MGNMFNIDSIQIKFNNRNPGYRVWNIDIKLNQFIIIINIKIITQIRFLVYKYFLIYLIYVHKMSTSSPYMVYYILNVSMYFYFSPWPRSPSANF